MILERYIHREILHKAAWIVGLLMLVLASNRFVGYLADAAAGKLPAELILQILLMKLLAMTPTLLPVAFFLGVMMAFSRLSRDKELTVVSGAGVGEAFQMAAVFRIAAGFALLVLAVSFYLAPWAQRQVEELKARAEMESDVAGVAAGQFREFRKGDRIVYVESLSENKRHMQNVFLQVRQDDRLGVLLSPDAVYEVAPRTGSRYVIFESGRRYVGSPGDLNYQITEYGRYAVLLQQSDPAGEGSDLTAIPTSTLIGSASPLYRAELQWRLSYVIAALLLPLLGVAMNRFSFNEHRYTPVFAAVFIYFIYSNLLGISKTLFKRDQIPGIVGLWWVHLLLIAIILGISGSPRIRIWLRRIWSGLRSGGTT